MHWIEQIIARVDSIVTAVEHAKTIGTFDADDRSKQYPLDNEKKIIDAVNLALTKVRQLEAGNRRKDAEIADLRRKLSRYRVQTTVLISIITGLAWEGLKALIVWFR